MWREVSADWLAGDLSAGKLVEQAAAAQAALPGTGLTTGGSLAYLPHKLLRSKGERKEEAERF